MSLSRACIRASLISSLTAGEVTRILMSPGSLPDVMHSRSASFVPCTIVFPVGLHGLGLTELFVGFMQWLQLWGQHHLLSRGHSALDGCELESAVVSLVK